ncbi:MAG TPA: 30S ribosomal protein THX [Bacteroidia bacterium]|jgi:30S ribosomal protein S31|nr:30S ribosomal protein THX [Bacteroidia bacterium]
MGKGDKKTRKGKITIGSYGNTRPRKKATGAASKAAPKKAKAAPKKAGRKTPKKEE